MILSQKHSFLFVHTRKTAGSAIKLCLADHLGDRDLVIGSADEILASGKQLPRRTLETLRDPISASRIIKAWIKGSDLNEVRNSLITSKFHRLLGPNPAHPNLQTLKRFVGPAWNEMTKFAFTRNPYDRTVSDYLWRKRVTQKRFSFSEFVDRLASNSFEDGIIHKGAVRNWDMISDNGKVALDFVGRYENLDQDFLKIASSLGIEGVEPLQNFKAKVSPRTPILGYYCNDTRKKVSTIFGDEIEYFAYKFPET